MGEDPAEYTGKALLFVGGGVEALPGIEQAKALGLHVVVSDMNPRAPGLLAADAHLLVSTYDEAATVAAARNYHEKAHRLDGVMCVATDVPLTVAAVAADLDLPGIPLATAQRAMDKLAMKDKFTADGVPVPWYSPVHSAQALTAIVAEQGLPLVLKPVDSRGGRGVQRLMPGCDLTAAFGRAHEHSTTGRVMVERYLPGPQISTESIVLDGVAHTLGFADRNYEYVERYAPFFIENGGTMPSILPSATRQTVEAMVEKAAASLGVINGVVKGDIVVSNGMPYVIELAARLSGGWFCTHQIPFHTGVDPVLAMIRLALGLPVAPASLRPSRQQGVAMRLLFPPPGRVISIDGVPTARQMPGVQMARILVATGDEIRPPTDSNASAGLVIAIGDSAAVAAQRAQDALDCIRIETEPT